MVSEVDIEKEIENYNTYLPPKMPYI